MVALATLKCSTVATCGQQVLYGTVRARTFPPSQNVMDGADQELFPDRGLGYPVKEGEEERGAGKESGERQRRRLE